MKISIRRPVGYSQIGRKDQQEDAVWPLFSDVSTSCPCIVLCDGVGGSQHGEVASQTSSKVIGEYLTRVINTNHAVGEADIHDAVSLAYDELEKIDIEGTEDGVVSMATTLACICLHKDGILAAHMGDSRIYLIRPGQGLLYQSADHSLLNALLNAGELTIEETQNFPRKNVITKAIQPHAEKRFKAEVHLLTDIQSGDYIFLCCDGVLEQLTNERLVEILSMDCSDKEKVSLLEAESTERTKDNYSAYLVPIDKVKGASSFEHNDEVKSVVVETAKPSSLQKTNGKQGTKRLHQSAMSKPNKMKNKKFPLIILSLLLLSGIIFFMGRCSSNDSEKSTVDDMYMEDVEESK